MGFIIQKREEKRNYNTQYQLIGPKTVTLKQVFDLQKPTAKVLVSLSCMCFVEIVFLCVIELKLRM